ncbi:Uncharacterised protein [Bordetella pertussis]|nr:Uncharacterised protein [Bordetella pertussis]CFP67922.1 Uncharacterised protein [Bordetella pertussis]
MLQVSWLRNAISPVWPAGSSMSLSSTMRRSMPGRGLPQLKAFSAGSSSRVEAARQ